MSRPNRSGVDWSDRAAVLAHARVRANEAYRRNPEQAAKRSRAYYKKHRKKILAYKREWQVRNIDKRRAASRRWWGLPEATRPTPQDCESCGRAFGARTAHLDHDHETGQFRGWLCNRCNLGIGQLGDTVAALERALAYLKRSKQ